MVSLAKDVRQRVQGYIDGVLNGSVVTGSLVRLCVERHVQDLEKAGERGYWFDANIATRACCFFPMICRHSIGEWAGQSFVLSPWQEFCTWVLFGWRRHDEENTRRFRRGYFSVARKNGKTTWLAAVANLLMFADEPFEHGADLFCAATKEDQARLMYREAARMVQASPDLSKRCRIYKSPPSIQYEAANSSFRPLGSDSEGTDGLNPHAVLMDELHAWTERHRELKEKLTTGGGARRQPLEFIITTAGSDDSQLWIEEDKYAVSVLESVVTGNIIDDSYFAFVARLDDGDDYFDEKNWPKANPNLGKSVKIGYLRDAATRAKNKPSETNQFIRYHCNRSVAASTREISIDDWQKGAAALQIVDGDECHGGIDLARSNDWAAISLCFPIYDGNKAHRWEIVSKAWTVKDGEFPVKHEPFRTWIEKGLLICCDGDQIDFGEIEAEILRLHEKYRVNSWAFDPAWARELASRLHNNHSLNMFEFGQTHRFYNEPLNRFVKELRDGNIIHGNDPVLGWQAGNVLFHRNTEGLVKPDKSNKMNKIDGMVASFMAFSECLFAEKQRRSYYENNKLEIG